MKHQKPKAPKITYVVRWNGAVLATRLKTRATYTHAVVGQINEQEARDWAYATPATDERYRDAFDYYTQHIARATEQLRIGGSKDTFRDEDRFNRCKAAIEILTPRIADGFDVFAEQWRERRIKWFNEKRAAGCFEPRVLDWLKAGERNTLKRDTNALRYCDQEVYEKTYITEEVSEPFVYECKTVPIETETSIPVAQRFAKMSKKAQRELLGLVCDKMIERQNWDEIAILLTSYLEGDAPLVLKLLGGQR